MTSGRKEIVDYCCNAGLYTVINIHHFDEFVIRRNSTEKCAEIFTRLWTQIAEYFKDYPYTVMFEGYNEYLGGKHFNAINQKFVDVVRGSGGNNERRHLLIASYRTSVERACNPMFVMPNDPANRMAVSVHYYGPSTLTLLTQDAEWGKARTDRAARLITRN